MKERNINLDLLKVLACFAVVGLHVFKYDYNSILITYLHYACGFAVPVFFMVNGYLILNKKEVTYPYVLRKILSILLVVTLWNALLFLAKLVVKHHFENPVILVIKSLVQKGSIWQFWFLGAMILTYLAAPLLHKLVHRYQKAYGIVLGVLAAGCLALQAAHWVKGGRLIEGYIQTFRIWTWLLYFVFGGYARTLMEHLPKKLPYKAHAVLTAMLFLGFPVYQIYASDYINYNLYYDDPVATAANVLLFTFLMRFGCGERLKSAVSFLAPLGMGCYIIHPFLLKALSHFVGYSNALLPFVIYPSVLAAAFGITWVLRRFKWTKYFVNL